jgi:hypothetical protein
MDTVNGLSAAQVQQLLAALEEGPHLLREKSGKLRLHHAYIRARLTQIFGFNGWGEQNLGLNKIVDESDRHGERLVAYAAQIRLIIRNDDGSVRNFFDGAGAWGVACPHDRRAIIWEMHSDAMNGASTVALCRAVINLGEQFGLSIYSTNGDDPYRFGVGYSLPHQPLSHLYGAGDTDPEQEGIPGVDVPEAEHMAQDPA